MRSALIEIGYITLKHMSDSRVEHKIIEAIRCRKLVIRPSIRQLEWGITVLRARRVAAGAFDQSRRISGAQTRPPRPKPVLSYDEQVQAKGAGASEGYPYFIEAPDGWTYFGRLDNTKRLPRISTDGADSYIVYWGEDALEKSVGE